jgi:hypothetical protein
MLFSHSSFDFFHSSYNTYSRLDCYIIACVQKLTRTQTFATFFSTKSIHNRHSYRESDSLQIRHFLPNYDFFLMIEEQFRFVTHFFLFEFFSGTWLTRCEFQDMCASYECSFPPLFLNWTCVLEPYWKWYCSFSLSFSLNDCGRYIPLKTQLITFINLLPTIYTCKHFRPIFFLNHQFDFTITLQPPAKRHRSDLNKHMKNYSSILFFLFFF